MSGDLKCPICDQPWGHEQLLAEAEASVHARLRLLRALEVAAARVRVLEAKYVPVRTWLKGTVPSVADQALARGVPAPFGQTMGEIRAQGYDVRPEAPDYGVLIEDAASPTGARVRVKWLTAWNHMAADPETDWLYVVQRNEAGAEECVQVMRVTARLLRRHRVAYLHPMLPDWAETHNVGVDDDGYIDGIAFASVPAIAPSKEVFAAENVRRAALDPPLPPLEDWRCPRFRVRTMSRRSDGTGWVAADPEPPPPEEPK